MVLQQRNSKNISMAVVPSIVLLLCVTSTLDIRKGKEQRLAAKIHQQALGGYYSVKERRAYRHGHVWHIYNCTPPLWLSGLVNKVHDVLWKQLSFSFPAYRYVDIDLAVVDHCVLQLCVY